MAGLAALALTSRLSRPVVSLRNIVRGTPLMQDTRILLTSVAARRICARASVSANLAFDLTSLRNVGDVLIK